VIGVATAALSRSYGVVVPASTVGRVVAGAARQRPRRAAVARHRRAAGAGRRGAGRPRGGDDRASHLLARARRPGRARGLLIGDIVVRAAGQIAADLRALRDALAAHVGKAATLSILRGGVAREVEVEVGEWPTERRFC
jgi:S1-C subfamily serine protease